MSKLIFILGFRKLAEDTWLELAMIAIFVAILVFFCIWFVFSFFNKNK